MSGLDGTVFAHIDEKVTVNVRRIFFWAGCNVLSILSELLSIPGPGWDQSSPSPLGHSLISGELT